MSRFVVLACGGRDYADRDRAFSVLDELHASRTVTLIVNGACIRKPDPKDESTWTCADYFSTLWAIFQCIEIREYPADWSRLGRAAGPIRNQRMLDETKPDLVVAFPGGRGTADMVRRARAAGVEVREIR